MKLSHKIGRKNLSDFSLETIMNNNVRIIINNYLYNENL